MRKMPRLFRSMIGRKGGLARARALTPAQLTEIAYKAVEARRAKPRRKVSRQRMARLRLRGAWFGPVVS